MDRATDPRLSAKRGASRSPDGQSNRKASRPNPSRAGSATSLPHGSSSRQSSVSNGASRRPMQPPSTAEASRASAVPKGLNTDASIAFVRSPDSTGSRRSNYEDANSGHSTPMSAGGMISRFSVPPPPPPLPPPPMEEVNGTSTKNGITLVDLLVQRDLMNNLTTRLLISKEQFESRLRRASREYDREQKTVARDLARRDFDRVSREYDEQVTKQKALAEVIAALMKPAEVQPTTATSLDVVALGTEMKRLQAQVKALEIEAQAAKSFWPMERVENRIAKLETRTADLTTLSTTATDTKGALGARLSKLESASAKETAFASAQEVRNLQSHLKAFQQSVDEARQTANDTKSNQGNIRIEFRSLHTEITQIWASNKDNIRQIDVLRADMQRGIGTPKIAQGATAKAVDELWDKHAAQDKTLVTIGRELETLSKLAHQVSSDNSGTTADLKRDMTKLQNAVHEKGNETLVKRLNNHDVLLNNLASDPPIKQRISRLEQDSMRLEASIKALRSEKPLTTTAAMGPAPDLATLQGRLDRLEAFEGRTLDTLNQIEDSQKLRDDVITTHWEGEFAEIRSSITAHRNTAAELSSELQLRIGACMKALDRKGDKEWVTKIFEVVDETIKQLGASVAKISRTPTPAPAQNAAPQFGHASAVNGGHAQASPSPNVNGKYHNVTSEEAAGLWAKLDAMTHLLGRLQAQYNNITTDTVVQNMLDQFATVWPHAKNFECSNAEVKKQLARSHDTLEGLRAQIKKVEGDAGEALRSTRGLKDAKAQFDALKVNVEAVERSVAEYRGKVAAWDNAMRK
ncbi:hypothetical protein LTR53_009869 [Teratosphaeriaceae sp. CCFEE 6253]|nr:hypothetical protein LTR53_009869 [Teratosphaeriaceae sp. CCFEE 6253]